MKERLPSHLGALQHRVTDLKSGGEKPTDDLSRRQMLLVSGMNAASLVAATSLVGKLAFDESESPAMPRNFSPVHNGEIHPLGTESKSETSNLEWWKDVWYVTPKGMVGKNVDNHLEWSYIEPDTEQRAKLVNPKHLPKILPPIAFHKNLEKMLEVKKGLVKHRPEATQDATFYSSQEASYAELFQNKEIRKMDLKGFSALIEKESHAVLSELRDKQPEIVNAYLSKHLDGTGWKQGTPEREKYEAAVARCLQSLAERITPDMMLAYITTELMPAPERAKAMLEFLTQHAGLEFVERIPALGDSELSFGPFQLTPYAVGEHGSVTNLLKVMHSDLVPNSLEKFSAIEDHLRAGFLFAFHNVLTLVQEICKDGRYDELLTILEGTNSGHVSSNSSVFLEFISAAHHRPESARKAMHTWLAANKSLPQIQRSKTLEGSFTKGQSDQEDRRYAEKARHCFENIRKA